MLEQPRFVISSIGAPLKSVADLAEWSLKVLMTIPAFKFQNIFEPAWNSERPGLCGLTKLSKSWEHSSSDLKPSVREIYSSNVLRLESCAMSGMRMLAELYPFSNSCAVYENL